MSFLDNLENTLKSAESREERESTGRRGQKEVDAERARARLLQPVVEELRSGKFTNELLNEVVRISFGLRTKVYVTWIGTTLRLEAREHRLELVPTPDGVVARTLVKGEVVNNQPVDLKKSAKSLAEKWLASVGPRPAAKTTDGE